LATYRDGYHPSTNPTVHGQESNSRPVDHKSYAITITLPSHLYISWHKENNNNKHLWQQQVVNHVSK